MLSSGHHKNLESKMTKITVTLLALVFVPGVAIAECSGGYSQTSSCQTGSTWDADKGECVADVNA